MGTESDAIAALDRRIERLRSQRAKRVTRRQDARRKLDVHCKILVAGALLALLREEPDEFGPVFARVLETARARSESDAADLATWEADRAEQETVRRARAPTRDPAQSAAGDGGGVE